MASGIPEDRVTGRAVPLPEEAGQRDDRRGAAKEIRRDSEERVDEATKATAPGAAAEEHRRGRDRQHQWIGGTSWSRRDGLTRTSVERGDMRSLLPGRG